jgi:hypothetical protein
MKPTALFLAILVFFACKQHGNINNTEIASKYENLDTIIFHEKQKQFSEFKDLPNDELFTKITASFIGRPYKAKTLEADEKELLVVNLREFDCTTLIETALALSHTIKAEQKSFNDFQKALCKIRYRNGSINNYTSRLHYFTDWINDNTEKGLIKDVSRFYGGMEYHNTVNFMSTHTYAYEQLKNDSSLVLKIIDIENEISKREYHYIPKEKIHEVESELPSGLIVAFTTNIEGLDVVHTGITYMENDGLKLLHASSDEGKVVISEKTLSGYTEDKDLQNGIILAKIN